MPAKTKKIVKTKKLTKVQMRILICKDVIKHFKTGKIEIENCYVQLPDQVFDESENSGEKNLKTLLEHTDKPCGVCAKGSLFIAHVLRFNQVSIDADRSKGCIEPLLKYFSREQLDLIEGAYEGAPTAGNREVTPACEKFNEAFCVWGATRASGLVRIMKNVIRNNGVFMPLKEKYPKRPRAAF